MEIRPLAGLKVLDFSVMPPGAYCTTMLADLGADVVRIEALSQKGRRSDVLGRASLGRAKRSVAIDLRHPRASAILARLARGADIVVENMPPGMMAKRGFGYDHAAAANPLIIWCSITGFGQDGPYSEHGGHDISYLAHSGFLSALARELPWHPGVTIAVPTGGLMAALGVQAAILERQKSGRGCRVDISLSEASSWLLGGAIDAFTDKFAAVPLGPDRRLYLCSDGRFVALAAAEPRTWTALCEGLDVPDLTDKLHKPDAAAETAERLAEIFATRPAADWVTDLGPLGASVMVVNEAADVARDPHVAARRSLVSVAGELAPANPIRLVAQNGDRSGTNADPPHLVGEDTDAVMAEAGLSADEIGDLQAEGLL